MLFSMIFLVVKRKIAAIFFVSASLLSWASRTQSEPARTDPRYAQVIGDQVKFCIDTLFAPSDFLRDEPELMANVILPAFGLASYDDGNSASN